MSWLLWLSLACWQDAEPLPPSGREVLREDGATAIPGGESAYWQDYNHATEAIRAGDLDAAQAIYEDLLLKEPNQAGPRVGLGSLALMRGDLDRAEMNYQRARQQEPMLITPHIGLGAVDMERGANTEAEAHYREALALDERSPDVHLALHNACREAAELHCAKTHGKRYVALAPEDANAAWVRTWLAAQP